MRHGSFNWCISLRGGVCVAEASPSLLPKGGGVPVCTHFKCGHQASKPSVSVTFKPPKVLVRRGLVVEPRTMSDSIKNVAIFGATGMTGQATLDLAVAAGEE